MPSKFASYAPFLSCLETNFAEIQWTSLVILGEKSINISAVSVYKWLRKNVSDATFEGKIQQPELKERALMMRRAVMRVRETDFVGSSGVLAALQMTVKCMLYSSFINARMSLLHLSRIQNLIWAQRNNSFG